MPSTVAISEGVFRIYGGKLFVPVPSTCRRRPMPGGCFSYFVYASVSPRQGFVWVAKGWHERDLVEESNLAAHVLVAG